MKPHLPWITYQHNACFSSVFSLDIKIYGSKQKLNTKGAIHSTKISGNFGPKLNGSVRSNRKSFEKTGPPSEVVLLPVGPVGILVEWIAPKNNTSIINHLHCQFIFFSLTKIFKSQLKYRTFNFSMYLPLVKNYNRPFGFVGS